MAVLQQSPGATGHQLLSLRDLYNFAFMKACKSWVSCDSLDNKLWVPCDSPKRTAFNFSEKCEPKLSLHGGHILGHVLFFYCFSLFP